MKSMFNATFNGVLKTALISALKVRFNAVLNFNAIFNGADGYLHGHQCNVPEMNAVGTEGFRLLSSAKTHSVL